MLDLNTKYRYTFATNTAKEICPRCKNKSLRLFLDTHTNQICNPIFGKCDKENTCNFYKIPSAENKEYFIPQAQPKPKQTYIFKQDENGENIRPYIPNWFIKNPQADPSKNQLFKYLCSIFPQADVQAAFNFYDIGTTKTGSCIFPYLDLFGNCVATQVRQYNDQGKGQGLNSTLTFIYKKSLEISGKKIPAWLDDYTNFTSCFGTYTCLFGEHRILENAQDSTQIWLVESPKTALFCSLYFGLPSTGAPLFLSCRTLGDFKLELLSVLEHYNFIAVPDTGKGLAEWTTKAKKFNSIGYKIKVLDVAKYFGASKQEQDQGLDIADFLERYLHLEK